jgi:hypothetical protein
MFHTDEAGTYTVLAQVRTGEPAKRTVQAGEEKRVVEIPVTDQAWREVNLGEIELGETGDQYISFRPESAEWTGMELGAVTLQHQ